MMSNTLCMAIFNFQPSIFNFLRLEISKLRVVSNRKLLRNLLLTFPKILS